MGGECSDANTSLVQLSAPAARAVGEAMSDGLYRVCTSYLCAGFVIRYGKLVACAPILRRNFGLWRTRAERIGS